MIELNCEYLSVQCIWLYVIIMSLLSYIIIMLCSPNHSKSENFTSIGSFCPKYMRFELKKYRGVIFHDTEQLMQNLNKPSPCGFKNGIINWVNFHQSTQSLKNCTMMCSFCPKHIMFQLENVRRIMCHDTERWCKV